MSTAFRVKAGDFTVVKDDGERIKAYRNGKLVSVVSDDEVTRALAVEVADLRNRLLEIRSYAAWHGVAAKSWFHENSGRIAYVADLSKPYTGAPHG